MNLSKAIMSGFNNLQKGYQEREIEKQDYYRAGSAGCYVNGEFYGTCPRKSIIRRHLIQMPTNFETHMIFTAGFAHEANLINLLLASDDVAKIEVYDKPEYYDIAAGNKKLVLKNESIIKEIPGTNIKISGRPDLIVTDINGNVLGVEAKANTSEGKSMGASVSPYIAAICQASLYKDILGIDYQIVYACSSGFGRFYLNHEVKSGKCPKEEEYPLMEYRKFPSGIYFKVPPSMYIYNIAFDKSGNIHTEVYGKGFIKTPLTINGIYDFYKEVDKAINEKKLCDRPTDFELNGEVKYSSCKYCDYLTSCDKYDKQGIGYDDYIEDVRTLVEIRKKELQD